MLLRWLAGRIGRRLSGLWRWLRGEDWQFCKEYQIHRQEHQKAPDWMLRMPDCQWCAADWVLFPATRLPPGSLPSGEREAEAKEGRMTREATSQAGERERQER